MQRVLIVGGGGHAQVVADILMRARDAGESIDPIGYLDDRVALHGQRLLDVPVLGPLNAWRAIEHDAVVIAVGNNTLRRDLFGQLHARGERFVVAKHPSAVIAPDVEIGPGTVICAGAIVNPGSRIGANVVLNTGCTVDHHTMINDHVHVAPGAHLGGDVHVGEGTLVGIGAIVMPQRRVGAWSIVGAGALAHTDTPNAVVVAGVPGKIIRHIEHREG